MLNLIIYFKLSKLKYFTVSLYMKQNRYYRIIDDANTISILPVEITERCKVYYRDRDMYIYKLCI